MADASRADDGATGSDAREIIRRQAEEIARLRDQLAHEHAARDLRGALGLAATAGIISSRVTHTQLLDMIVETAAQVISARAASLFVVDREAQELVFAVALGEKADAVKNVRVPLGHGIAGLVAVTGQPMAIADARHDPRQAANIAQSVGYVPESILAVPLFFAEEVVGVIELLDKEGAPSFSAHDIEILSLFANQAAVALEQSRAHWNIRALLAEALQSGDSARDDQHVAIQQRARTFVTSLESDPSFQRALALAQLVRDIAWLGDGETQVCRTILQGFADYLRSRSATLSDLGLSG